MKMKRKIVPILAFAALLSGGLVGCAPSGPAGGSNEINVAVQAWQITKLHLDDIAKKFEADNPGTKVNLVEYVDNQTLSTFSLQWSQGKSDQDIVMVDGAPLAIQFLTQNLIIDFNKTDFFSGPTAKDQFVGKTLDYTSHGGVQFAVPLALEVYGITANKKFFSEAGLTGSDGEITIPTSWQDIYNYADKMTERDGAGNVVRPGLTIQWGSNAINSMIASEQALRGSIYKDDGTTLTFDTPEMREILAIWKKGVDRGIFSMETFTDKAAGQTRFNSGQLPMLLQSAAQVAEAAPTIGAENARLIPIPGSDVNGSRAGIQGLIVPKASTHQELALKFIKEGLMSDAQVQVGAEWGKLPVLKKFFQQIDAPWAEQVFAIADKSEESPAYRDLPKLTTSIQRDLQEFLLGRGDVDAFVAKLESMIASADKSS